MAARTLRVPPRALMLVWARRYAEAINGDMIIQPIRYSADPSLSSPVSFLRAALADLVASVRPARLFALSSIRSRYRRAWLGYLWLFVPATVRASVASMTGSRGEVELAEAVLGTIWIHVAQLIMVPSLKGKIIEVRRQLLLSSASRQDRKPLQAPAQRASR